MKAALIKVHLRSLGLGVRLLEVHLDPYIYPLIFRLGLHGDLTSLLSLLQMEFVLVS